MENIRKSILENRNVLSLKNYRVWLLGKLAQYGIDRSKLVSMVIVVERTLGEELDRIGSNHCQPFYRLWKNDGKPTRAWIYAAELALWLKYNEFKANPYVRSIVTHPLVRSRVLKPSKKQIPLNILFPATRTNTVRMSEYSKHFRIWLDKHG